MGPGSQGQAHVRRPFGDLEGPKDAKAKPETIDPANSRPHGIDCTLTPTRNLIHPPVAAARRHQHWDPFDAANADHVVIMKVPHVWMRESARPEARELHGELLAENMQPFRAR